MTPKKEYAVPFIKEIFKIDTYGNRSIKSIYYQNILRCFLDNYEKFFKVREILNNLIKENKLPLRTKQFNTNNKPKSKIIEDREKTFRSYFQNLTNWNLLESRKTKSKKGNSTTLEYGLTEFGHLMLLLIETDFADNKEKKYNELYKFLETYFLDNSYFLNIFCMKYFKKCKDLNLFGELVDYLKSSFAYNYDNIENDNDLFTNMIILRTSDRKTNKILWKLWRESFDELDRECKGLFLHHMKIKIERMIENKVKDYSGFEDMRYMLRNSLEMIPVELYCSKCNDNSVLGYYRMSFLMYLRGIFYDRKRVSKQISRNILLNNNIKFKKCGKCGKCRLNFIII